MSVTTPAPDDLAATLAVVVSRLDDLRLDVGLIRTDISGVRSENVPRGEWEQRNNHVDSKFSAQGREIADLRTELHSRRAPWWSVGAIIISGGALGWSLLSSTLNV